MKKIISLLLAAAICLPCVQVSAETITVTASAVSGEAVAYGELLKASYTGSEDAPDSITWERVTVSGAAEVATGTDYIVTEADMGAKLRVKADFGGNAVYSTEYDIASYVSPKTRNTEYAVNKNPNSAKVFKLKGSAREFILAETFNNDVSKYYVVANEVYGTKKIEDTYSKFDSEADGSFQKWLNTDFITNGNGNAKLPTEFADYIDMNHLWRTEGTTEWKAPATNVKEYVFKAGVTIPSISELIEYSAVGYTAKSVEDAKADTAEIMTRTPVNATVSNAPKWVITTKADHKNSSDTQVRTSYREDPELWVRPQFYLKDGFFANVAVDLETAGTDVIAEIKKEDSDDLYAIYSSYDCVRYLGLAAPAGYITVTDIKVTAKSGNSPAYGEEVVPSFKYDSSNQNPMASYTIKWVCGGEEVSTNNNSYIVTEADAGKKLKFFVTVRDTRGNETRHESAEVQIPSLACPPISLPYSTSGVVDAPAANVFKVGDDSFTLLDNFNNPKSTYFVAANALYGTKNFNNRVWNTDDSSNLSNWLNNTFLTEGNGGKKLPEGVTEYIDFDHLWLNEAAPLAFTPHEQYTHKAGVALISVAEINRYNGIFGFSDAGGRFWTRTHANHTADKDFFETVTGVDKNGVKDTSMNHWDIPNGNTGIRPVFYLNEDFFRNTAIDLDNAGANVISAMKARYTVEELAELYSEAKLEALGFNHEYELSASFTAGGGAITSLEGVTEVTAEVTLTSNVNEGLSGLVIFIAQDENKATKGINFVRISTAAKSSKTETVTITGLSGMTAGGNLKVMLWDDSYHMNVLSNFVSLN